MTPLGKEIVLVLLKVESKAKKARKKYADSFGHITTMQDEANLLAKEIEVMEAAIKELQE